MKTSDTKRIILLLIAAALVPFHLFAASDAEYIVKFKDDSALKSDDRPFEIVSLAQLGLLLLSDELEWYEKDGEVELLGDLSQYYPDDKWDLEMVGADASFSRGLIGEGVRVGVIDSGINPHEFIADRLVPGHNYIKNADPGDTSDSYGHGTSVAGLIAEKCDEGYLGAAAGVTLVPLKCTDEKSSVKISAVCDAIYGGVEDYDCDILNLSLGISAKYESLEEAVAYAEEKGVVIVSAVGNDGTETLNYPAAYDTVIGVGGVDENGLIYERSNHNASTFITAPAVNITSAFNAGGYAAVTGTSFSAPQVTAAAAILLGAMPELTPEEVRTALAETAADAGSPGYDEYYGHGILSLSGLVGFIDNEPANTAAPETTEDPVNIEESADEACAKDESCLLRSFSDLDPEMWYHDGLHYVLERGIMNGTGNGRFSPDAAASRAMIVTILWRLENEPQSAGEIPFLDVPDDAWYYEAVKWAANEGIVSGFSADSFAPDASINREQLAAILWRYAGKTGELTETELVQFEFSDSDNISGWALEAMRWAVSKGIINGVGNGRISPQGSAVRAQVATILMRFSLCV